MNIPPLTIIIPHFNGKESLKKCINSLKKQEFPSKEIIVIDNASSDDSTDYLKKNHPDIRLIENKTNRGYAAAVNQGIRSSKSEYILLLNNDVYLEKDSIQHLLNCIQTDKNIFGVSARIIQYHNPEKMDDAGDEYTLLGWTKRVGYGKSPDKYNFKREIFSACAAAAIYRRSILEKIGYLDENFFAYLEDVDISYRARINGYKCFYTPQAVAYHVGSATTGSRYNAFKIKLAARNNIFLLYKNMPGLQLLLNLPFLLLGFFIKYIFFIIKGYGKPYHCGIKEGLFNLSKIKKTEYERDNLINYFKIEYLLIKNTLKFIFY